MLYLQLHCDNIIYIKEEITDVIVYKATLEEFKKDYGSEFPLKKLPKGHDRMSHHPNSYTRSSNGFSDEVLSNRWPEGDHIISVVQTLIAQHKINSINVSTENPIDIKVALNLSHFGDFDLFFKGNESLIPFINSESNQGFKYITEEVIFIIHPYIVNNEPIAIYVDSMNLHYSSRGKNVGASAIRALHMLCDMYGITLLHKVQPTSDYKALNKKDLESFYAGLGHKPLGFDDLYYRKPK